MDLSGVWRAAVADDDLRRTWLDDDADTDLGADRRPRPLALHARVRRQRRAAPVPHGVRARPPRTGRPPLAAARRALLPGRRLAGRELRRRHRGLLLPPRLRGHRRARGPDRAPARHRGDLQPPAATGRASATSPARSSTATPSTRPGTPGASGGRCGSSAPGRSASATCASAAARPPRSEPSSPSGRCSTPPSPPRRPSHSSVGGVDHVDRAQPRRRREPGRVDDHRPRAPAVVAPHARRPAAPRGRGRRPPAGRRP